MKGYRPDFSDYLAHFTTGRKPVVADEGNPTIELTTGKDAYDRLISILENKRIASSHLPWKGGQAVCFTECPWSSMIDHAKQYSPYGVGFAKPRVFAAGGSPVYYVRADHWEKQDWDSHIKTFVTPFWPEYRPPRFKTAEYIKTCDFSHEREWRVPHDFTFQFSQIEFVVVKSYEDMARFPQHLKDAIGRDKFIIYDVYMNIERLWPVHNF
jgi:hypothetical protein